MNYLLVGLDFLTCVGLLIWDLLVKSGLKV